MVSVLVSVVDLGVKLLNIEFLSYALAHEIIESKIYFEIRIVFDVFVPDTTEESNRLALAQATSHTIMDYFNQYVFAETTANSISEITYTETMTFWSTLISAPLVYFGSWAVKGTDKMMGEASVKLIKAGEITRGQAIKQMLLSGLAGMALSPIKEVFEEIIKDGFTEALAENLIDMAGGSDVLGFWVSSFVTSRRETTGALGQLALGDASLAFGDANLMTKLSLIKARIRGDANTIAEISATVKQNVEQKQADADAKRQQMKSWQKLFSSGFFKGLLMVLPAVLYGSFSFVALKGLNNMIESTQSAIPKAYARYKSEVQAHRKGKLIGRVGTQDTLVNNLQEQMKKPAELEAAKPEINEKYKATQETEKNNPSLTAFLSSLNPNPKTESKTSLANKFYEILSSTYFESTGSYDGSQLSGEEPQSDRIQVIEKKAETSDLKSSIPFGDSEEGFFPEHDKATILNDIYSRLFHPEYDQNEPKTRLDKLIYRSDLASEARDFLETTTYRGLEIILDGGINYRVLDILRSKYDNGEKFTKLERIISDVGCYFMGGPSPIEVQGKNELAKKRFDENKQSYSTLELVKDLTNELQKQPELLAKLFPDRLFKYSNIDLSQLWGHNRKYIQLAVSRIRHGQYPNFRFKPKGLSLLKDNIAQKLGVRALGCLKIIKDYKDLELTTLDFIDALKKELGRVSGDIKVTKKELSEIFGKSIEFISSFTKSLEDPYNNDYKNNYKFSKEIFSNLKENSKVDKYSFKDFLSIIEEFERLNLDIPEYSLQRHTITKVNAFKDIFDIETAYWFGFLCADGHVSRRGDYKIAFDLNTGDIETVKRFADFVGFERSRIYPRPQFRRNAEGRIKRYESSRILFGSKIMNGRLQELGFFSSKSERKAVPDFVKQAIELAKEETAGREIHWSETAYGKIAHSWLLGFFDGDGTHHSGYTAILTASSKELLLEIKDLFGSPNRVLTKIEPGTEVMVFDKLTIAKGAYTLTIGADVFRRMLASYAQSMDRKRPDRKRPEILFGDFPFVLSNYYEPSLIKKLMERGIEVDQSDLAAIVQNREGRIVWLEQGSKSIGFEHILLRHGESGDPNKKFSTIFGISDDPVTIGNFIFKAITRYPIYKELPGAGGRSKFYVYRIRIEGVTNYLHVLVHDDGSIITAYPSEYSS